ncbi:T9SS type A sorting domain-containing protein [Neolewinella sp.]|uniref:T9SS type A sorting domain-containing protein n=1 Tax=Neolewinella sp. TaxID=2993543 RepID=UPI003B52B005
MHLALPHLLTRFFTVAILFSLSLPTHAQSDTTSLLPFSVYLEAECGVLGSNWREVTDSTASDSAYIVIRPGLISKDTPPADADSNLVTFTLSVQEADFFRVWGRVLSNSPDEDSFWVRVNGGTWQQWSNRLRKDGEWIWREVAGSPFYMAPGTATIDFAYREPNTLLDKVYVSSLRASPRGITAGALNCEDNDCASSPDGCSGEVWIEAECGTPGNDWIYTVDTEVSNGGYFSAMQPSNLTVPTATELPDQVKYEVEVTETGTYYMYARMATPDLGKNSFFVKIDEGDWVDFNAELDGSDLVTEGFEWKQVNNMGDTLTFDLDAGDHTIYLAKREAGTQIDKLHLRQDTIAPTGFGKVSLNCVESALTPTRAPLDLRSALDVFPNPVGSQLTVRFSTAEVTGRVQLQVIDMTGRVLSQQSYGKLMTELQAEVNVDALAPGLYRVLLTTERGVVSRPFVKR